MLEGIDARTPTLQEVERHDTYRKRWQE